MKVLVTGANGLLAPYIVEAFSNARHEVSTTTREGCDLTRRASVKALLLGHSPDAVVHCAALTDIDECEREPLKALEVNRDVPWHFTGLMGDAKFVYISTDMVYPDIRGPHRECDVGPVNMYGRSKLAGEKAAAVNQRHLILRTNFFGPYLNTHLKSRPSFSSWVTESLQDGSTPIFFNDAWWSPLHMKTLSAVIVGLVERDMIGIYNLGANDMNTKAGVALMIARHKGLMDYFTRAAVGPAHWRTKRPKDMSLDCSLIESMGVELPTIEEEVNKL